MESEVQVIRTVLQPSSTAKAAPSARLKEAERALKLDFDAKLAATRRRTAKRLWSARKRAFTQGFAKGERAAARERAEQLMRYDHEFKLRLQSLKAECSTFSLSVLQHYLEEQSYAHVEFLKARIAITLENFRHLRGIKIEAAPSEAQELKILLGDKYPVFVSSALQPGSAKIHSLAGEVFINWREDLAELCDSILSAEEA